MQCPMQLQDPSLPSHFIPDMRDRFVMQTVDVLGDDMGCYRGILESRECAVGGVGFSISDRRVTEIRA